ncbi:hypothetical protein NDU88_005986, partial [Pleurodeles waltl]
SKGFWTEEFWVRRSDLNCTVGDSADDLRGRKEHLVSQPRVTGSMNHVSSCSMVEGHWRVYWLRG